MNKYLPLLANLTSGVIFGFAMLFMRSAMGVVNQDTVKYLAFRFTVGFIVMSLMLIFKLRTVNYRGKPLWILLLCGGLNPLISQITETSAITYAPTAQIAVFMSLVPVLVVLLSVFINREKPTKKQVFFVLVSVSGVLIINLAGGNMSGGTKMGAILIAISLGIVSLARVFVRRASMSFTAFETIYITTGMGAIGFSIITTVNHAVRGDLSTFFVGLWTPKFVIPVLYMGICSCVVAFLCLTYAVKNLPIAVSAATGTLNTVISILVGVFIIGEQFKAADAIGAAVILGGILGMSLSYNTGDDSANQFKIASNSEEKEEKKGEL